MSRKDYELIARAIREQAEVIADYDDPRDALGALVRRFASALAADNPRFDAARFHAACEPTK